MSENISTFEELLAKAGDLGRWQLLLYAFIGLNGFFMGFQHLGSVFLAATPDHWCSVAGLPDGWAQEWPTLKSFVLPTEQRNDKQQYSQCSYYARDYSPIAAALASEKNSTTFFKFNATLDTNYSSISNDSAAESVVCNKWEFDTSQFSSTIVTQWQLVCGSKTIMSSVQALYMGGVLVGCIIFGCISDRWGRRRAILIAQVQFIVMTVAASFSPHLIMFLTCRFLMGMAAPGIFACPFVLVTEVISLQSRGFFGVCYQIPFGIGYATLPGLAYFIRDWQWLQFTMSVPSIILLSSYWVLPESPRWLITRGRYKEALLVLKRCANANRRKLPADDVILTAMNKMRDLDKDEKQPSKSTLIKRLFRSWELRKRMMVGIFTWIVVALVYYGLAFESPKIGGNIYLMVFLGGILEIPAYLLGFVLVNKLGRRIIYSSTFILASASSFAILAVPSHVTWLSPTLAVAGKFFITIAFAVAYLYTAELFPTVVRNVAVNLGSMGGRMGSISAPYIVYQLGHYHDFIPLAVFGTLSLLAGLLALLLPETNQLNLAETVADLEDNQTSRKSEPMEKSDNYQIYPAETKEGGVPFESYKS